LAGDVDAAFTGLVNAHRRREEHANAGIELWRLVATPRPGLIAGSRVEKIASNAEGVVMAGGELPGELPPTYLPDRAEVTIPELGDEPADVVSRPRMAR
jgi:hypothetical protein